MRFNNRKVLSIILSFAMIIGIMIVPSSIIFAEEAANKTVDIVSFNDFHGAVEDKSKNVGMAKMIAYSKTLLEENSNTLFVSGGDSYQGTAISNLTYGKPVSAMMKAMGVVASAVGNHEFDWGTEYIPGWAEDGGFDFLATNIVEKATGKPVTWAKPYKIVEVAGIKIAFLGLAHKDTATLTKAEFVKEVEFTDPVVAAKEWVKFLKDGKAKEGTPDVIIALTHIDSSQDAETKVIKGNITDLAAVEGLDGIISAHSHKPVAGTVNEIPIVQASHSGRMLGMLSIELDKDNKVVGIVAKTQDLSSITEEIVPDPEGLKLYDEFALAAKPILSEVLGEAAEAFVHESKTSNVTLLGRWSSEVMKDKTGVQIAIQNGGGLRRTLEKGTITMGDLYEIMPFDNKLVTMELSGADVKKAIDHGINNPEIGNGQFAGLKVVFDKDKDFEDRIVKIMLEDGTPLEMDKYYTVVTNDFLLTGGDKYDFSNAKNVLDTYIPAVDYLTEGKAEVVVPEPKPEPKPEPVPEPVPTPEPEMKKHVVVRGDTLWRIGLNNKTTWQKLAEYNSLKNPHLIFPGQIILIN